MNKFLIAVLVLIFGAMAYIGYYNYVLDHPAPIAKISKSKGLVNVRRDIETLSGQIGTLLYAGDQLSTSKNSYSRLLMADGTVLMVGANSSLGFNQYNYDSETKILNAQLKFIKGAYRFVTGKVVLPRSIQISDSRGTKVRLRQGDLFIGNINNDELDVLLLSAEKAVSVSNKQGKQTLEANYGTTVIAREAPADAEQWSEEKVAAALALVFEH